MSKRQKQAIIIGAGPAGLTAAFELLTRTDIVPIVLEATGDIGGIAKTINYKGNRIDIGGHRFFSKSDRVMQWWMEVMPLERTDEAEVAISYQAKEKAIPAGVADPEKNDLVMLVRRRLSRIFFLRKFFSYPISLSLETIRNLGFFRTIRIGVSYIRARLFPIRSEKTLEDFFINRFGRELYKTFFKDYTEKVWGVACSSIPADWGAQRVKGLSITKALRHAARSLLPKRTGGIAQHDVETSLIERFLYPKFGPGQLWEEVARRVRAMGGMVHLKHHVRRIVCEHGHVVRVVAHNDESGKDEVFEADYVFSTMPIKHLIRGLSPTPPASIREIANGLVYRDFMTVGLLLRGMNMVDTGFKNRVKDNWIYIQEPDVKVGRLQIFNNWSPYLVKDERTVWIGMEYFVDKGDALWNMNDKAFTQFAIGELVSMGMINAHDVLDSTVIRIPKTYPAYFGTYDRFAELRAYVDTIPNLFLIGRNGMHRYNNQDHSMLTAMTVVDGLVAGHVDRDILWNINAEQEYHEEANKHTTRKN